MAAASEKKNIVNLSMLNVLQNKYPFITQTKTASTAQIMLATFPILLSFIIKLPYLFFDLCVGVGGDYGCPLAVVE